MLRIEVENCFSNFSAIFTWFHGLNGGIFLSRAVMPELTSKSFFHFVVKWRAVVCVEIQPLGPNVSAEVLSVKTLAQFFQADLFTDTCCMACFPTIIVVCKDLTKGKL